ncbi:NADPH-dependent FMN reductase [Sphingobium xenophagum]|uniref:NADPH-dependent FMN reductase n=1 Tax=Sphingobium xenophagum TaxID=121428 RepID=UPI00037F0644|nr:NAD(P)H-dependent oxidoreductase [Sphingobium xenophagum]
MPLLGVIICSTRPGRVGPAFATWFAEAATAHGAFDVTLIDVAQLNLPLFDEPKLPSLREYTHDHTRAWSGIVMTLDAVVFVSPEYNHGPPPAAVNALSYLAREWAYMPAGFVGYGGLAGGARAIQTLRLSTNALRMMPMPESVLFPNFSQHLDANGQVNAQDTSRQVAGRLLDELSRWTGVLAQLRASALGRDHADG